MTLGMYIVDAFSMFMTTSSRLRTPRKFRRRRCVFPEMPEKRFSVM
jgi:hypothetical protein